MSEQAVSGKIIGLKFPILVQDDMFGNDLNPSETAFYVKVTPGTPLYEMTLDVNRSIPGISRQKCVRILARAGYDVFRKRAREGEE